MMKENYGMNKNTRDNIVTKSHSSHNTVKFPPLNKNQMFSINENNIEDHRSDEENKEKTYIKNKIMKKDKRSSNKENVPCPSKNYEKENKERDKLGVKMSNIPPNKNNSTPEDPNFITKGFKLRY